MDLTGSSAKKSKSKNALAIEPIQERQNVYASDAMAERRSRILSETRKLISDGGLDEFSIRTLCKRANVAPKTIYNVFHSKDRLIAIAIREAYEGVNRHIRYRTSPDTIEGIVDRLISVNTRNFKAKHYTRAVTSLYFSGNVTDDVWNSLRSMVFLNLHQWLDKVEADGDFQGWMNKDMAGGLFANLEYSVINDWAFDRLPDEEYIPTLILGVLSLASGMTRGATHEAILKMLQEIEETGELPVYQKPVFVPGEDQLSRAANGK